MKFIGLTSLICAVVALTVSGILAGESHYRHRLNDKKTVLGNDNMVTQTREVESFQRIKTDMGVDIFVTIGRAQSLKVTFDENLIDFVETEVYGKTLRITANNSFTTRHQCRVEITVPSLEAITSQGSGDIEVMGLAGDEFSFTLEGSGSFHAAGTVDHLDIELSGSGDVDTRELLAHSVKVVLDGSGDVVVYADEAFDGTIDGSGDIAYYGDPEHASKSVSGSGRIRKR